MTKISANDHINQWIYEDESKYWLNKARIDEKGITMNESIMHVTIISANEHLNQ
jgi:hypothetical protein